MLLNLRVTARRWEGFGLVQSLSDKSAAVGKKIPKVSPGAFWAAACWRGVCCLRTAASATRIWYSSMRFPGSVHPHRTYSVLEYIQYSCNLKSWTWVLLSCTSTVRSTVQCPCLGPWGCPCRLGLLRKSQAHSTVPLPPFCQAHSTTVPYHHPCSDNLNAAGRLPS